MSGPVSGAVIERLIAARDGITGLNISDYALIREAREAMAEAANALDSYAKTVALIEKIDSRVVAHLMWLDERARNSSSYGSHADAYEIAARRLREAMSDGTENLFQPERDGSETGTIQNHEHGDASGKEPTSGFGNESSARKPDEGNVPNNSNGLAETEG